MSKYKLGTIINHKGFKGEIKVMGSDKNIIGLKEGAPIFIGFSEKFSTKYTVEYYKKQPKGGLLKLKEINSEKMIADIKENGIFIETEHIIKDPEKELLTELISCDVYDIDNNNFIGKVIDIWELPANNVWLLDTEHGELPIPEIPDVIKKIDIINKKVFIHVMDGLLDLVDNKNEE